MLYYLFKGSKKSTPFAATEAVADAMAKAMENGVKEVKASDL